MVEVTKVALARDATAAQWMLQPGVNWWDLVRYGPPGFEAYVRIEFPEDPGDEDAVRAALAILASCTTTPDSGFAAIWEGWGGNPPAPPAPRLEIPNREMLLFTGPVDVLRDAAALAWDEPGIQVEPHLVWPEDRAWCLACEVDEEIEFTVGCSSGVAGVLCDAFPGRSRRVPYGAELPLYRDKGR